SRRSFELARPWQHIPRRTSTHKRSIHQKQWKASFMNTEIQNSPPNPSPNPLSKPPRQFRLPALFRRLDWRVACVSLLALIAIPGGRATTGHAKPGIVAMSTPQVSVCPVTREDLVEDVVCNAELRPYQEIDLHAKVAGYLETITVDIGDRVKAGQLLATIE